MSEPRGHILQVGGCGFWGGFQALSSSDVLSARQSRCRRGRARESLAGHPTSFMAQGQHAPPTDWPSGSTRLEAASKLSGWPPLPSSLQTGGWSLHTARPLKDCRSSEPSGRCSAPLHTQVFLCALPPHWPLEEELQVEAEKHRPGREDGVPGTSKPGRQVERNRAPHCVRARPDPATSWLSDARELVPSLGGLGF